MNIVMLTGSPRKNGTTALLCERFEKGLSSTHHFSRFDTAFLNIAPCSACDYCRRNSGRCRIEDDMGALNAAMADADLVVLATPLYYYGMTAQLKTAIDRFYSANAAIKKPKMLILLAACEDDDPSAMDALVAHVETFGSYLGWELKEKLLAFSCGNRADIEKTEHPDRAEAVARAL